MTKDEAESLARRMRSGNAILENAWPSVNAGDLRRLCDHILSGDHKREIENAAFERAREIAEEVRRENADILPKHSGWEASFTIAERIGSLIQPPAQKENG